MKYKVFISTDGETQDDAKEVLKEIFVNGEWVESSDFDTPEDAAEAFAEQYRPYAEWYSGHRDFEIIDEKGQITNVRVELEYNPIFTARAL